MLTFFWLLLSFSGVHNHMHPPSHRKYAYAIEAQQQRILILANVVLINHVPIKGSTYNIWGKINSITPMIDMKFA